MDLLGDLGAADQLTSTRAENKVLKERIQQLDEKCRLLTVENETLKVEKEALTVEVELYRQEASASTTTTTAGPSSSFTNNDNNNTTTVVVEDAFCQSGNGEYPSHCEVTLENLHEISNILTCALSADDTILATGGADSNLSLVGWGQAMMSDDKKDVNISKDVVQSAIKVKCSSPVIVVAFAQHSKRFPLLAAGCMDGSVQLVHYSSGTSSSSSSSSSLVALQVPATSGGSWKHTKYIKAIAWSTMKPMIATASADGSVQLYKIQRTVGLQEDPDQIQVEKMTSWQLSGPVESIAFVENHLFCYARGTPILMAFDLDEANVPNFQLTKINLNHGAIGTVGFDDHVSFAVMDIAVDRSSSENGGGGSRYLALATDMSRNIILDWKQQRIVRNLYGHQNDGFSNPKVAWSKNGQYIFGTTQGEASICVWDVASASIVQRLGGSHTQPIRDLYSSSLTNTLVSTSFDKKTNIWFLGE